MIRQRIITSVWTYLIRVHRERTLAFTVRTEANPELLVVVLMEGTDGCTTFGTVKLDVFQLGEHTSATSDNTGDSNEIVKMGPTQVAEGHAEGKVGDAYMHVGVDPLVCWEVNKNGAQSDFVEDFEHSRGRVGEEVGKDGLGECQVKIRNFERLGVG